MHMSSRALWVSLAAVLVVAVSACGGGEGSNDASNGSDTTFESVTIAHALGTATISERPKRIVTLGQGSAETVIALGLAPVGIEAYPWGSDDSGYLPWINEALKAKDMTPPAQIPFSAQSGELDYEAIAKLEPDLILAPWSGITQEQYDRVESLAPTVAYAEEPWVITWEEQIATIGKAVGMPDEAADLTADIKSQLEGAARKEYEGLTFSYIYTDGPGTLGVFFDGEQRVAMVKALGLTPDPILQSLREFEVEGTDSARLSLENADKLKDSDLIFTFYPSPESRQATEAQPAYRAIPAVERGSLVAPTDPSFVTGSSLITPLTVPWVIDRYVPMIDAAAAKVR